MNHSNSDKISSGTTPQFFELHKPPILRQSSPIKTSPFLSRPTHHFTCTNCKQKFPTFDPDCPREKICSLCKYDQEFATKTLQNLNDSINSANSAGLDTPNPKDHGEEDGSISSSKKWVFDEDVTAKFLEIDLKEGREREFPIELSSYGVLADVFKTNMNYYDNRVMTELERLSKQINSGYAPITERVINSLKEMVCESGDALSEEECSICKDEYKTDDHILQLPCGHNFHKHCVTQWLYQRNCCPFCRSTITKGNQNSKGH